MDPDIIPDGDLEDGVVFDLVLEALSDGDSRA